MKRITPIVFAILLGCGPARASDFASEVMEATFKLFHPDSTSTCFLVRRDPPDAANYLVTTGHTLEKTKGETAVLVLREARPDGSYQRRDFTIHVRRGETPLWVRHAKQDVAVLRLDEPLPVPVPALPLSALADEARMKASGVHVCSPLYVLTYPQRFEANGAGFPVARQGIFASPPLLPLPAHPTFLADFTTFAGDSGGPAFIDSGDGHPLIVGITLAQHFFDVRVQSDYEDHLTHHPLGLGVILHPQYIREAIDAAKPCEEKEPERTLEESPKTPETPSTDHQSVPLDFRRP